jgi:hypothetical protein
MVAPVLDDYAYMFTDAGVLLNGNNNSPVVGVPVYDVYKVTGLDLASVRTSMRIAEGEDGGTVESEFLDPRTLTIEGTLFCHSSESIEAQLDALKSNFQPSTVDKPLYIKSPGVDQRVVFCKSLGVRYDIDQARRFNSTSFSVILQAQDPVVYGSTVKSFSGALSSEVINGHGFDHAYDLSFGGASSTGSQMSVVNAGTKAVGAIITLYGPVTGPRIISDTVGVTLNMSSLVAGVSDIITIDLKRRTVKLNGASRRGTVAYEDGWFLLVPGTNILRYQASSSAVVPISGTYRDGYF